MTSAAERTRCSTTTNRAPGFVPTRADCPPSIEALARMHLAVLTPVNHAACSPQALNAKDRGKPPAEPDASLHSLYAETMAGHVEGDDSTETAVLTLTKKEEVAESSSSPARRGLTHPSRPRPTRHVREPTGCASGHGATNTLLQLLQHADDRLASAPISRPGSDLDVIWRLRTRTPGASGSCPSRTVPCCRCCYSTVHTNVLCC